jgi:hypothetical protein
VGVGTGDIEVGLTTDFGFSNDDRGRAVGATVVAETGVGDACSSRFLSRGGLDALRPKKESKPPIVLPAPLLASGSG